VNKKMPNNVATEVEGDEEEVNPNEFQDNVLSCLADLQHLAVAMKEKAEMMENTVRNFRASIHGEDIDGCLSYKLMFAAPDDEISKCERKNAK
jgi:hypothetical protein